MSRIKPDNPAARLYLILNKMKRYGENVTVGNAWSHALDDAEGGKLRSQIGMVFVLPREIQKQLQRRPDYDIHEMTWWEPLSRGLTQFGLSESWSRVSDVVSEDILGAIRSSARTLSVFSPEPVLEDSVVQELRQYIKQIRESMNNESEADEDLIEFLSQRLTYMEDLLDDIKIVGAVGVKHNIETVIEEVEAKVDEMEEELSPQTWEWWKQLMSRTRTVCATIVVVSGTIGTVGADVKALTAGAPQIEDSQHVPEERMNRELPSVQDDGNSDEPTDADYKDVTEDDEAA